MSNHIEFILAEFNKSKKLFTFSCSMGSFSKGASWRKVRPGLQGDKVKVTLTKTDLIFGVKPHNNEE